MNSIYRSIGISKQGFHQWMDGHMQALEEEQQLIPLILQIRQVHPRMGAKTLYSLIRPCTMGRDKFEQLYFKNGFKIEKKRAFHKTTNSLGVTRFDNLIAAIELTDVNQVCVSDITYYRIEERFYYLTFIMDLFSRYIVGFSASVNLLTEHTTIPALKMALRARRPPAGLIIHSDGGGQYYSKKLLYITNKYHLQNSMCESVYENANAERINGTIKNDYLIPYNPQSYEDLQQKLKKAVYMYNCHRPHKALNTRSPQQFEKKLTETEAY